jgi:hypothetical protein
MSYDLSSVENFISSVANSSVVKPAGMVGTGGFLFDVRGNDEVTLESEATDHFLEDNTAVQDHIAMRPAMITLKGYMGQVKDTTQNFLAGVLGNIQSLGDIGGLAPGFSQQAAQAYSKIESVTSQVNNVLSQASNIAQIFKLRSTTQTPTQMAFQFFENIRKNNILCTVETPFKVYTNMIVVRLGAIEREESNTISDFSVTFKEIRTVSAAVTPQQTASGRSIDMLSDTTQKGPASEALLDNTLLAEAF